MPRSELQAAVLDAVGEALAAAFILCDGRDRIVFASRQIAQFFPVAADFLKPGARLRDLFAALYDTGCRVGPSGKSSVEMSREEWVADHISAQWRERSDVEERDPSDRWIRYSRRRLPSGYGLAVITDVTDRKKREEQWRADMERVQLTEEILDTLHCPIFVLDPHLAFAAVNRAFCALQGRGADGLLGAGIAAAFEPGLALRLEAACRHTLASGAPSATTERLALDSGDDPTVVIRSQRVGKPGRYFVVATMEGAGQDQAAISFGTPMIAQTEDDMPSAPAQPSLAAAALGLPEDLLAGRKILLVTKDRTVEAGSLRLLQAMGADACAVGNIAEEEAFLRAARSLGMEIDLVLIDAQMEMRCLELAEGLARDVLALDAFELTADLPGLLAARFSATAEAAGADDWEISTVKEGAAEPAGRCPTVLVAEDNAVNQIVFSHILENLGYRFRIAESGEEAVRLWQELDPAIVLMDVTLPLMNGLEASRAIRELDREEGRNTPIVGVMVQSFDNGREECLAAGMNDVILKPLSPEMVGALLERFLGGHAVDLDP